MRSSSIAPSATWPPQGSRKVAPGKNVAQRSARRVVAREVVRELGYAQSSWYSDLRPARPAPTSPQLPSGPLA
jgi:hypothetical protein